ncbi:MAG TPA: trigger factor, partial [Caldilineaceae bacterium]|nr:trigger factor [Caldilineaceae bacterium]
MALRIQTEPMENRQMALRVEVDQERVDQELRKAARKISNQYRIPGFRQGKAPYSVVVQYVGLPALINEFLEPLGQEVYRQAIEEAKIEPYAMAQLDVDSLEPLTYKFVVPLEPEVDLGDYRNLRLEEPQIEVDEADIQARLEEYREQFAGWREVNRPSQYGDMLTVDVRSVLIPEEGQAPSEETVVLDETDWDITLDKENPLEPPGFDEALLGLRPGEEKEFVLSWPADSQSIYAGKQARFRVKVNTIQAHEAPPLDDAFAQLVGPDFQTLDDLKARIREELEEKRRSQAENEYLEKALDALVAQSKLVYPPVVIEDQLDVMVSEFERQLRRYGIESLEDFLRQSGQTVEEYRESLREQAETIARRNLVISELYRKEGIEVTDEDIEARINAMLGPERAATADDNEDGQATEDLAAEAADVTGQAEPPTAELAEGEADARADDNDATRALRQIMRSGSGRAVLESQILQEKALDRLLMIVRGEELPELPPAELVTQAEPLPTEAGA